MQKVVLVTGAGSGIGLETAKKFLEKGAIVLATSRNLQKSSLLEEFALSIRKRNLLHIYQMDVDSEIEVRKTIDKIAESFLKLDVVVNNAGFGLAGALEDISVDEAKQQFETNFFGCHRVTLASLPLLRESKGTLINISSMGGKVTFPFFAIYNASKHALESYTEGLWMEFSPLGIAVYLVEPGLIETNFYSKTLKFPKNYQTSKSIYKSLYEKYSKHPEKLAFGNRSHPSVVAKKIVELVKHRPSTFRHPIGKLARIILFARWLLPDRIFLPLIAKIRG